MTCQLRLFGFSTGYRHGYSIIHFPRNGNTKTGDAAPPHIENRPRLCIIILVSTKRGAFACSPAEDHESNGCA